MSQTDLYHRVFIFSQQQMDLKIELGKKKDGKAPKIGTVIVNGTSKMYTDILRSADEIRFSDSIVLLSEDIRKVKFKEGSR